MWNKRRGEIRREGGRKMEGMVKQEGSVCACVCEEKGKGE